MTPVLGDPRLSTPAALLVLATTLVAVPAAAAPVPTADRADLVRLCAPPGEVVWSATVDLTGTALANAPDATLTLRTTGFSMVGATWRGAAPGLELRTSRGGEGWSAWRAAEPMADGPAPAAGRGASDLLWVDEATGIQVRAAGPLPAEADLVLIDPRRLAADAPRVAGKARTADADRLHARAARSRPASAPRPPLLTRNDWQADPSWRNGQPRYNDKLRQVHVHHTATGNGYSRAEVPGILRGMYRYHTRTLGWFDIGYNFLVDRFGRAWVGRSGGVSRLVRGAHTLGFNHSSVGIAVIGSLESRRPSADAVTTVVKLAAWKLDKHRRDARGRATVRSTGSDNYRDGERVRLPVIDGHRDTNDTACPGDRLYARLPEVRRRAQWRIDRW
jgi:uncharacterized protein with LGFP repeats